MAKQITKEELIDSVTAEVLSVIYAEAGRIPVAVSNRHIHLSQKDLDQLFGLNYSLKPKKFLMGDQFAAEETVKIVGKKEVFESVRVLGPPRDNTQVEIAISDSYRLGVNPPIKNSGDLESTPGIVVIGPQGVVNLKKGLICAKRHIHMPPEIAEIMELQDEEYVGVKTGGERSLVFQNVLVRVRPDFKFRMHIDIDEANAAALGNGDLVELI